MSISHSTTYKNYTVAVTANRDEEHWHIEVTITDGELRFKYCISEPYLHTFGEWSLLIEGKWSIGFYLGNGDGDLVCSGEYYIFRAAPSGAGGDVCAEFKFKREPVSLCLRKVINDAVACGWKFENK